MSSPTYFRSSKCSHMINLAAHTVVSDLLCIARLCEAFVELPDETIPIEPQEKAGGKERLDSCTTLFVTFPSQETNARDVTAENMQMTLNLI